MLRTLFVLISLLAVSPLSFAQPVVADEQQPPPVNPPPPAAPGQPTPVNPPPSVTPLPTPVNQPPRPSTPVVAPAQPATPRPTAPGIPPPRAGLRGRDANVLIELTITDQTGSAPAEKKVVSLVTADQAMGRIRASADAHAGGQYVATELNVDARPVLLEGSVDRILLEMTIEYTPVRPQTEQGDPGRPPARPTKLHESLSVIVTNGKPMLVSQAADPVVDRKMTVEVKVTIVK